MAKGITAYIYRPAHGDCSNNGLSASDLVEVTVTGGGVPEFAEPTLDAPEVVLLPAYLGGGFRAVPVIEVELERRTMFGGCFVWSSDSRFRRVSEAPIALHDRVEG